MPPSPTPNAPANLEQLKELLKDDTKVKVAGKSSMAEPLPIHHSLTSILR